MSARVRWMGLAARGVAVVALIAAVIVIGVGLLTGSGEVTTNGVLMLMGTVLATGVTYAAVFEREKQLARRASPRRG